LGCPNYYLQSSHFWDYPDYQKIVGGIKIDLVQEGALNPMFNRTIFILIGCFLTFQANLKLMVPPKSLIIFISSCKLAKNSSRENRLYIEYPDHTASSPRKSLPVAKPRGNLGTPSLALPKKSLKVTG